MDTAQEVKLVAKDGKLIKQIIPEAPAPIEQEIYAWDIKEAVRVAQERADNLESEIKTLRDHVAYELAQALALAEEGRKAGIMDKTDEQDYLDKINYDG